MAPHRFLEGAGRLANALGMVWGVFLFDARHRLVIATSARRPSDAAAATLGRLLEG